MLVLFKIDLLVARARVDFQHRRDENIPSKYFLFKSLIYPLKILISKEIFIKAGGIACAMNMIVKEKFLSNADDNTKK